MNSASKQMDRLRATSGTAAAAVSKGTAFGVVLLVVSMLMIIIGSATNEWYKIVPNNGSATLNFGLFHYCFYTTGVTSCVDFSRDSHCTNSMGDSALFSNDAECAKFNTTRGLVLISIFTNGFALAAMIAVGFLGRGSPLFGFGFSILTALLGLIATSIFGSLKSDLQNGAGFVPGGYDITFDWSFALFTTGWIVCMLSGPFIVKGSSKD